LLLPTKFFENPLKNFAPKLLSLTLKSSNRFRAIEFRQKKIPYQKDALYAEVLLCKNFDSFDLSIKSKFANEDDLPCHIRCHWHLCYCYQKIIPNESFQQSHIFIAADADDNGTDNYRSEAT
jgi:hypothetical protein